MDQEDAKKIEDAVTTIMAMSAARADTPGTNNPFAEAVGVSDVLKNAEPEGRVVSEEEINQITTAMRTARESGNLAVFGRILDNFDDLFDNFGILL